MTAEDKCRCGATVSADAKFCDTCGAQVIGLPHAVVCPHCGKDVTSGNFCAHCGGNLFEKENRPFAAMLQSEFMTRRPEADLLVRHGTKALFFEDGRLVKTMDAGCYRPDSDKLLGSLFKSKKLFSAVVVDAGDVVMQFHPDGLKTRDGLPVQVDLDLVYSLEDPNLFYVNVMKNAEVLHAYEMRSILESSIREALTAFLKDFDYEDLKASGDVRHVLESVMEANMRRTLERTGLTLVQTRSLMIKQPGKDEIRQINVEGLLKAEKLKAEAAVTRDVGGALLEKKTAEIEHYEKRQEIFKRILSYRIDKIKTEEDFRKFQMEVDRDRLLDDAEWKEMQDEVFWKEEDRRRDRAFLVNKIKLQQQHELALKELVLDDELDGEARERQRDRLQKNLEFELGQEAQRAEHRITMARKEAEAKHAVREVEQLGEKKIEIEKRLADLRLREAEIKTERDKQMIAIEIKEAKSRLGLSNLEEMKAIKRRDEFERDLHRLKIDQDQLDMRLKAEAEIHRQKMEAEKVVVEKMRLQSEHENTKLRTQSGMTAEQILAAESTSDFARVKEAEAGANKEHFNERMTDAERRAAMSETFADKMNEKGEKDAERLERITMATIKAGQARTDDTLDRMQSVSTHAMDSASHAAAGQKPSAPGSSKSKVTNCRKCHHEIPEGANFCKNCGEKTY